MHIQLFSREFLWLFASSHNVTCYAQ